MASPSCLRLLVHWARRAASRAAWTAGRSRAISTAMIAITTSSSISVKPARRSDMAFPTLEETSRNVDPGRARTRPPEEKGHDRDRSTVDRNVALIKLTRMPSLGERVHEKKETIRRSAPRGAPDLGDRRVDE